VGKRGRWRDAGMRGRGEPTLALPVLLAVLLALGGCGALPPKFVSPASPGAPPTTIGKDPFSRIYPVEFLAFHSEVNSALQEFAREQRGNSFQISRLGSDAVTFRGQVKRGKEGDRVPITLQVKPAGGKKTIIEIKFSGNADKKPADMETVAGELFLVIEKKTGAHPL
jgi:hypothetical protein